MRPRSSSCVHRTSLPLAQPFLRLRHNIVAVQARDVAERDLLRAFGFAFAFVRAIADLQFSRCDIHGAEIVENGDDLRQTRQRAARNRLPRVERRFAGSSNFSRQGKRRIKTSVVAEL